MTKGTTFFKDVAGHNLERFHSECIAWVLNRMPKENKIFNKFNSDDDFEFVKAVAEVQDHDIILLFRKQKDKNNKDEFIYKYVFVENKTKSTLSRIKSSKNRNWIKLLLKMKNLGLVPKNEFFQRLITMGMLQTAFYQLRWLANENGEDYKKNILFAFSNKDPNGEEVFFYDNKIKKKGERRTFYDNKFVSPEWVILSQMESETFKGLYDGEENLNRTLSNLGLKLNDENSVNKWRYLTYECLFKKEQETKPKDDFDTQIFKEYINYARTLEDNTMDLFVKVKGLLKENFKEIELIAGSSNNPTPTIQIILGRVKCNIFEMNDEMTKLKVVLGDINLFGEDHLRYGVQLEGDNLKFFFSHSLYDYTKSIKGNNTNKEKYIDFVNSRLGILVPKRKFENLSVKSNEYGALKNEVVVNLRNKTDYYFNDKPNFPKSKSFYSFSKHIEDESLRKYWFEKTNTEKLDNDKGDRKFEERIGVLSGEIVAKIKNLVEGIEKLKIKNK